MTPYREHRKLRFEDFIKTITVFDIEKVRLVLRGDSVIDWHRLGFRSKQEVQEFLRVNGYNLESEEDRHVMNYLFKNAIGYLEDNFSYHFPDEIKEINEIEDLFLMASTKGLFQNLACIVLKVMHIVNHIEGQEARQRLPVTQELLFRVTEEKVTNIVAEMIDLGFPIVQYQASRKTRDSIITKLLGKPQTIAAQIFDRLRFRIVTKTEHDLLPVIVYLTRYLFPFNYVVPGESRNDILRLRDVLSQRDEWRPILEKLAYDLYISEELATGPENPFSASKFRMISLVFDLPLRLDEILQLAGRKQKSIFASVVFQLVELQMFDKATFEENEKGESSHEAYKNRQKWKVIDRLIHGNNPNILKGR